MTKPERDPFDSLMPFTCVGMGYCGSFRDGEHRHVTHRIPESGTITADQFVEWVIWADFGSPELTPVQHKQQLRDMFVRLMGADVVDARRLRWT